MLFNFKPQALDILRLNCKLKDISKKYLSCTSQGVAEFYCKPNLGKWFVLHSRRIFVLQADILFIDKY